MDVQGRGLSETVWTRMDRKAGAVVELTIRQLRHKISTWVVLSLGTVLMMMLLAFYVDAVREGFEPVDNDGDSVDADRDGYPWAKRENMAPVTGMESNSPGRAHTYTKGRSIGMIRIEKFLATEHGEGMSFLDSTWIDYDYKGGQWDYVIDWDDVTDCQDTRGEVFVDWIPDYSTACQLENGTYATNGKFTAEGNLTVPIDYFLSWGYITGIFDVPKDPKEMYIDEDDIDWDGSGGARVSMMTAIVSGLTGIHRMMETEI